jgi:hypothetical protein
METEVLRCATPHLPSQSWGKGNEQTRERTKHHAHLYTKNWNRAMCVVLIVIINTLRL